MELMVDQVIEELSKIDLATEKVLTMADMEKDNYSKEIDEKIKQYDKSLEVNMSKRLEEYRNKIESENNNILKQYRQDTLNLLDKLDESFKNNHTKWASEIFNNLIKE